MSMSQCKHCDKTRDTDFKVECDCDTAIIIAELEEGGYDEVSEWNEDPWYYYFLGCTDDEVEIRVDKATGEVYDRYFEEKHWVLSWFKIVL